MSDPGAPDDGSGDAATYLRYEEVDPSSSGVFVRLLIAPIVATLLLAGGVYWLRLQPPMGAGTHEQPSTVLVHLLPRPDPAPIPTPAPSQIVTESLAALAPPTQDEQDEAPLAVQPAPAGIQSQKTPPSVVEGAATEAASPSRAAVRFQQALLRHIGRYQRYPGAARRNHLQGTVETFFSMRRDGTLLDVWVKTSSGQAVLDNEAIETVRRAQPLPPIPPELPNRLSVQVLLAFDPS
jgi:protein TonB